MIGLSTVSRLAKSGRRSALLVFGLSRNYIADSTGFVMRDRLNRPVPGHTANMQGARLSTSLVLAGKTDVDQLLFRAPVGGAPLLLTRDEMPDGAARLLSAWIK
jgi:hypothetical protein